MSMTLAIALSCSLSSPIPKFTTKYETHRFTLADNLKKPTWELNYELQWKPDPDAPSGLEVVSWGLTESVAGNTPEGWTGKLFKGKKVGDAVTVKTGSEYLGVATNFTPVVKSIERGTVQFEVTDVNAEECVFHAVEAKFEIYSRHAEEFTFTATGEDGKIDGYRLIGPKVGKIGSGTLRITVAKHPKSEEFYVRAFATWVEDFGSRRQKHARWEESGHAQYGKYFQHEWRSVNLPTKR